MILTVPYVPFYQLGRMGYEERRVFINLIPKVKKLKVEIYEGFSYQFRYELGTAIIRNLRFCNSL